MSEYIKDLKYTLDTTEINIFQEETTLSVYDELDVTLPSGTTWEDTVVYKICVENICDVEVEAECVLEDDNNTNCCSIPTAVDP